MTNKSQDETGYSWQNYDKDGNKIQENSKTYEDDIPGMTLNQLL